MPEFDEESQNRRRPAAMNYEPGRNAARYPKGENGESSDRRRRSRNRQDGERSPWVEAATATPHEDSNVWKTKKNKDNPRQDYRQRNPRKKSIWQTILSWFGIKPKRNRGKQGRPNQQGNRRDGDPRGDRNRPRGQGGNRDQQGRRQGDNRPPKPRDENTPQGEGRQRTPREDRPRRDHEDRPRRENRDGNREDRPRRDQDAQTQSRRQGEGRDRGPRRERSDRQGPRNERPDRPARHPRPDYANASESDTPGSPDEFARRETRVERNISAPRSDDISVTVGPIEIKPKTETQPSTESSAQPQARSGRRNRRNTPPTRAATATVAATAKQPGEFIPSPIELPAKPTVPTTGASSDKTSTSPTPESSE